MFNLQCNQLPLIVCGVGASVVGGGVNDGGGGSALSADSSSAESPLSADFSLRWALNGSQVEPFPLQSTPGGQVIAVSRRHRGNRPQSERCRESKRRVGKGEGGVCLLCAAPVWFLFVVTVWTGGWTEVTAAAAPPKRQNLMKGLRQPATVDEIAEIWSLSLSCLRTGGSRSVSQIDGDKGAGLLPNVSSAAHVI